jgi:hypothetical protein
MRESLLKSWCLPRSGSAFSASCLKLTFFAAEVDDGWLAVLDGGLHGAFLGVGFRSRLAPDGPKVTKLSQVAFPFRRAHPASGPMRPSVPRWLAPGNAAYRVARRRAP